MTAKEFEKSYCKKSKISLKFYNKKLVTLVCECSSETCKGWAAVKNNKNAIRRHNQLYTFSSFDKFSEEDDGLSFDEFDEEDDEEDEIIQ